MVLKRMNVFPNVYFLKLVGAVFPSSLNINEETKRVMDEEEEEAASIFCLPSFKL